MLELNRVERQTERDVQHCGNRNLQKVRNYSGKRCGKRNALRPEYADRESFGRGQHAGKHRYDPQRGRSADR